jgi:hypothetical protein
MPAQFQNKDRPKSGGLTLYNVRLFIARFSASRTLVSLVYVIIPILFGLLESTPERYVIAAFIFAFIVLIIELNIRFYERWMRSLRYADFTEEFRAAARHLQNRFEMAVKSSVANTDKREKLLSKKLEMSVMVETAGTRGVWFTAQSSENMTFGKDRLILDERDFPEGTWLDAVFDPNRPSLENPFLLNDSGLKKIFNISRANLPESRQKRVLGVKAILRPESEPTRSLIVYPLYHGNKPKIKLNLMGYLVIYSSIPIDVTLLNQITQDIKLVALLSVTMLCYDEMLWQS